MNLLDTDLLTTTASREKKAEINLIFDYHSLQTLYKVDKTYFSILQTNDSKSRPD